MPNILNKLCKLEEIKYYSLLRTPFVKPKKNMILNNFKPFIGQHCETTATGSLLSQLGIELSEPMLFGIGEGIGFLYWKMKIMDFPFIGGRVKPDRLTENICRNLNLKLDVRETSSTKKAWENISGPLAEGQAVGLKLDCYHLDYFTNKIHFAGHYTTIYGYDHEYAYLNDTHQQGCIVKTSLENLKLARNAKGPMSSKNLSFTIAQTRDIPNLNSVIKKAIYNNAQDFLNPPIKNFGYKGMIKAANGIQKWFDESKDIESEFATSAMLMERAGTGGALFRNLYRDFLKEAYGITGIKEFSEGYMAFAEHAKRWTEISNLFVKVSETPDQEYLHQASDLLNELSESERATMELLSAACT